MPLTPHTEAPASPEKGDLPRGMDSLAQEIARVERRLVAREFAIHHRLQEIGKTARSALRPRRSMVPWVGALMMLWPLLPRFLRPRLSPASAITLFSMGLPLAKRLLTNHPAGPATVPFLDLPRYMGLWHEVASLTPRGESPGVGQPTVCFAPARHREGVPWMTVHAHSPMSGGRWRESRGVARAIGGRGGGRMKQSFLPGWLHWWPGAWDDHWVLHVDADYTVALVGDAGRRHLRVLSRHSTLDPARWQVLLALARAQGYDTSRMHPTEGALR